MPDRRCGLALCLAVLALSHAAQAQDMREVESNLKEKMEALQSASREQEALAARETELRRELERLQSDMVSIAGKIQRQEKLLSSAEANLAALEERERSMTGHLAARKRELAVLVQSMLKLSTVPPELVIAMPGDFDETMRTAKVLGLTSNALSEQARDINRQLAEIKSLQSEIHRNLARIGEQKTALEKDQSALEGKLAIRGGIQDQLHTRREEQESAVRRLSKESGNLRDLMAQLEEQRAQEAKKAARLAVVPTFKPDAPKPAAETADFAGAKGKIPLPAEGKIFIFYGDKTQDGDDSRGIRIRTREAAQVTSPFAGEVVYTGTFLDYGNMVIIRHANDYHSLLAGLARTTATLGQHLVKGEPVGEMGRTEEQTALYMEIRERNRPVDPIPWLGQQRLATR